MKKGQKLRYVGRGFIGYNPSFTQMIFMCKDESGMIEVYYDGGTIKGTLLVRPHEVEIVK